MMLPLFLATSALHCGKIDESSRLGGKVSPKTSSACRARRFTLQKAEMAEFTSTVWRPPLQLLSVSEIAASQPSPFVLAEEPWLKKGETISVKHFSTQPQHSLCLFPFVSSLGTTEKCLAPSSVLPPIKYLHTRVRSPQDPSQLNIPETKYSRNRAFSACKEALLDFMLCYTFIGDSSAFFE